MPQSAAAPRQLRLLFLGTTLLSALGSVMALLAATVVSSDAGATGAAAASYTSLMLALNLIMASLSTPYAPTLAHRFGTRRVYATSMALNVAFYGLLAAALGAGIPGFPTLMVLTPALGAVAGISHALAPSVLKGYLAGDDLASAETRVAVASGVAWAIGALAGAVMIDAVGPAVAFAANAALTLPFALVVGLAVPAAEPSRPARARRPWRSLIGSVRANPRLLRACLLGLLSAALVVPLVSMVVPVTRDLDHNLAVHAGLVLAAISLGAILSPAPVYQLGSRMGPLRASGVAYAITGVVLIGLAVIGVLLSHNAQLVAIAAVAVIYGAMSSAGSSLLIDDAAESAASTEAEQESLAAFFLVTGLGTPIGTVLWGRLIDSVSAPFLLAVVGAAMVAVIVVVIVILTKRDLSAPPPIARRDSAPGTRAKSALQHLWH